MQVIVAITANPIHPLGLERPDLVLRIKVPTHRTGADGGARDAAECLVVQNESVKLLMALLEGRDKPLRTSTSGVGAHFRVQALVCVSETRKRTRSWPDL